MQKKIKETPQEKKIKTKSIEEEEVTESAKAYAMFFT